MKKTARKYRDQDKFPSEIKAGKVREWLTREDPFKDIWYIAKPFLKTNSGLEAKTLFQYLQREHSGCFSDGQLRTFQRRVKRWRALEGPAREVYFPQKHEPGKLSQSDFTHMSDLDVTLEGLPFEHIMYHSVLTYSNWEWNGQVKVDRFFMRFGIFDIHSRKSLFLRRAYAGPFSEQTFSSATLGG